MYRILIVEDDRMLKDGIAYTLRKEGYEVQGAGSVREAKERLEGSMGAGTDLVLLDINLPDGSGFTLLKEIRGRGNLPVIVLTARDMEEEMIRGFDLGCDDYVTKPFSASILLRRIQAVLKRPASRKEEVYAEGSITYDYLRKELSREGKPVKITATEVKILEYFLHNRNRVLTREQILENIWDKYENYVDEKALSVNISRLRDKIEKDPKQPEYIRTVFGIGYKWSDH